MWKASTDPPFNFQVRSLTKPQLNCRPSWHDLTMTEHHLLPDHFERVVLHGHSMTIVFPAI